MSYQAILPTPFGKLAIRCPGDILLGIEFLPPRTLASPPRDAFTREVCAQLMAYFGDAGFRFNLPLQLEGTEHQRKVWQMMCVIPSGQTLSYGEIAAEIGSSPRAVGQACGNNPVPIVVPCHRVVGKAGLGGFMHRADKGALDIKRGLLAHERR
ncbi:MAG: methylated-DNA--[protein]-cysteine S-methyltransferase [Gallionellaceae bacterium]|nr:MAG: methylated-DNA--[protein]-cysteine S-methyltransferase [Gallionellaceae bacterium]